MLRHALNGAFNIQWAIIPWPVSPPNGILRKNKSSYENLLNSGHCARTTRGTKCNRGWPERGKRVDKTCAEGNRERERETGHEKVSGQDKGMEQNIDVAGGGHLQLKYNHRATSAWGNRNHDFIEIAFISLFPDGDHSRSFWGFRSRSLGSELQL